mgnify:CR=1 FL=1
MAKVIGSYLIAKQLKEEGVDTLFYLMGGPNFDIVMAAEDQGINCVDFRHEQAAAYAAHAYARVTGKPGVTTAASGPGTLNLLTGIYTAAIDCAPMVILGGAGPVHEIGREAFQEVDQQSIIDPMVKWSHRTTQAARYPEVVSMAFREAASRGRPTLLEPVMDVEIRAPSDFAGDLMGDLNSRRGRIGGMETRGASTIIKAQVPMAEMLTYEQQLTSATGGRGSYNMEFSHYEEVPSHLRGKIISEAKGEKGEETSEKSEKNEKSETWAEA